MVRVAHWLEEQDNNDDDDDDDEKFICSSLDTRLSYSRDRRDGVVPCTVYHIWTATKGYHRVGSYRTFTYFIDHPLQAAGSMLHLYHQDE